MRPVGWWSAWGPGEDLALDGPGQVIVERGGVLVDQLGPAQVDETRAQCGERAGKPAGQADRQADPVLGGKLSHGQGECDLVGRELGFELPGRRTIQAGIVGDTAAPGYLGDRGKFLRLRPRGDLSPAGNAVHQPGIVQRGGLRLAQPGRQGWAGRDPHLPCELRNRKGRVGRRFGRAQLIVGLRIVGLRIVGGRWFFGRWFFGWADLICRLWPGGPSSGRRFAPGRDFLTRPAPGGPVGGG